MSKEAYNIKEIMEILPHRYPFLLVDRIVEVNLEEGYVVGQKNVTMNEHFFQGHFPGAPIMPGVLILEALAQAGGVLVYLKGDSKEKIAVLLNIREVKFRKSVHPGDVLMLRAEERLVTSKGGRIQATATVDGNIVAQADVGFALVNKSQI
ncbi:MAG: 3-hydroxyacyl-ACP dehydratase FabZ [Waddliaceae bacterium]